MSQIPFQVRPPLPDELPFIYSSWLNSYYQPKLTDDPRGLHSIPRSLYYKSQQSIITHLLNTGQCWLVVNPEEPTQIYGYLSFHVVDKVCYLHWGYVKYPFRQMGIFTDLLDLLRSQYSDQIYLTHLPAYNYKLLLRQFSLVFNPYFLLGAI